MAEPNGLYYMRARYYDPTVGRFISEDPLGFGGGDVNLSAYVRNNPVNWVDPFGLYPGQMPSPLPGYDPNTWNPRWDPQSDRWKVTDPATGNDWSAHPEDPGHWRHWDNDNTGGSCPKEKKKMQKKQKEPNPDQSPNDPSGNAPEWSPPFIPFVPIAPIVPPVPIFEGVPIFEPIFIW